MGAMRFWGRRGTATRIAVVVWPLIAVTGCMMIGPDYNQPATPVATGWLGHDTGVIGPESEPIGPWWETFNDPILTHLVVVAYQYNPSLQAAGARVLEGQARRGIAIGTLFPQLQNAHGDYRRIISSRNTEVITPDRNFNEYLAGFDVAWEMDFWGKFRRGIESSDADLLAAVADYDDVLVSLLAEVAANYIGIRTAQEQLAVARENAELQRKSFRIASERAKQGAVTDVDPAQSATLLHATEAQIPFFQAQIEQQAATVSALMGFPPQDVETLIGSAPVPIPNPPEHVAIGIPADLLRRRPDVRRTERQLASQSAKIGIAKADLLPHLSLVGSINLDAEEAAKFFMGRSFAAFGGPTFSWDILNYGRISNNVRVQDAEYQALVNDYTTSVLRAQADVESALSAYRGALLQTASLVDSVKAARKVVDLVGQQYAEGAVDFTTVLLAQQFLVQQENLLVASRGQQALAVVTLYKSLGGGWETWAGRSVVSDDTATQMAQRTNWDDLLREEQQRNIANAASNGTEKDRGWWRWRWWRPQW
jgi:NodT family efflux transporter outer membrane factor (OMF) lipoprotein